MRLSASKNAHKCTETGREIFANDNLLTDFIMFIIRKDRWRLCNLYNDDANLNASETRESCHSARKQPSVRISTAPIHYYICSTPCVAIERNASSKLTRDARLTFLNGRSLTRAFTESYLRRRPPSRLSASSMPITNARFSDPWRFILRPFPTTDDL